MGGRGDSEMADQIRHRFTVYSLEQHLHKKAAVAQNSQILVSVISHPVKCRQ